MYEAISSSSSFLLATAISSARAFILMKNSTTVDEPFCVVAKSIRVLITLPWDWEAVMSWITFQISAAVVHADTYTWTSLDKDEIK